MKEEGIKFIASYTHSSPLICLGERYYLRDKRNKMNKKYFEKEQAAKKFINFFVRHSGGSVRRARHKQFFLSSPDHFNWKIYVSFEHGNVLSDCFRRILIIKNFEGGLFLWIIS